jgi:hypothetical protein
MNNNDRKKLILRFSNVFARLQYKVNFDINNTSSFLLATDLLRESSKRRLFKIVATNVETVFLDFLRNDLVLTSQSGNAIFFSLIKKTTQEFLTGCYGYNVNIDAAVVKDSFYTKLIISDEKILLTVPLQILSREDSNLFRSIFVPIYTKAYDSFIEALLDNLIVEITNAVMFIIINEFSFIYEVRKTFYRSNFLSLRNVERFRNNLSWQSRIKSFIKRPADIYNSQQGIWIIRTTGIYYRIIYANRSNELVTLRRFSLLTLLGIETKDFLSSRLDETIYFFGSSVRYTFTSIIGQVIGLIWRGVIEGLKK